MFLDTIVAIATPLHMGAISIIRVSGAEAISLVNKVFTKDLSKVSSHTIHYGYIVDQAVKLDEVLVSVFKAPKTFTGEDVVEINCHGGVYITKRILSLLIEHGCRLANPGEFTQRAFINGRIDLTQAEAINDMIEANDVAQASLALQGIQGGVRKLIEPLREAIIQIIAQIEVNIDYPEYTDVEMLTNNELLPLARQWVKDIDLLLKKSISGKIMKEGLKTVILGKPNVGKSSLLNALLEEDKAIVTDIEGTTRDLVEGYVRLSNVTLHLIDTAGIRDTKDKIEQIGIDKSKQALNAAELVLVLLDGTKPIDVKDQELLELTKHQPRIIVYNKADLFDSAPAINMEDSVIISAGTKNIEALVVAIEKKYEEHTIALKEPTLANERHIALLKQARAAMENAIMTLEQGFELDLATIDIQKAYKDILDILGEASKKELLDELFSRFCLGK